MKKNMDSENAIFKLIYTRRFISEITSIYDYISLNLYNLKAASRLISLINKRFLDLSKNPLIYVKIDKFDNLKREYHRIVVKNFVILYSVEFKNKIVYISHIYYGGKNYFNIYLCYNFLCLIFYLF
ncbi:MAG: type II toxin-antitoxin system RelE/ParE family toxin [Bacilli bacterium]|nr:type II toxin-antitoxin system RelE/ParE family toxin [Bacilli bacterium]